MPVVGFISQDGSSDQPEGLGRCSFDFVLRSAASGDSEAFPYPYPLLAGIISSIQERTYVSVTTVLHCLRAAFLKKTEDYYVKVEDMYPMFRGTLFHELLEANPSPNGRVEEKHTRVHRGIEISGTFDSLIVLQDEDDGTFILQDWKTTENLPKYESPYASHMAQVNLYRWLLGIDPEKVVMEVWYFSMGGVKRCRLKDGKQKLRRIRNDKGDLVAPKAVNQHWSDQKVEEYLDNRLLKLNASYLLNIPVPYDSVPEEDLWECDYCPVQRICYSRANVERESRWRKDAGLPPAGTVGDATVEWEALFDEAVRFLVRKTAQPGPPFVPAGSPETPVDRAIQPVPKPTPRVKAARRGK